MRIAETLPTIACRRPRPEFPHRRPRGSDRCQSGRRRTRRCFDPRPRDRHRAVRETHPDRRAKISIRVADADDNVAVADDNTAVVDHSVTVAEDRAIVAHQLITIARVDVVVT